MGGLGRAAMTPTVTVRAVGRYSYKSMARRLCGLCRSSLPGDGGVGGSRSPIPATTRDDATLSLAEAGRSAGLAGSQVSSQSWPVLKNRDLAFRLLNVSKYSITPGDGGRDDFRPVRS